MIEQALNHYNGIVKTNEKFLIIIDEAHRFRNEYTQDYALLHNLCSDNKVLLLTATPFNNKPDDIYSMLKLFQIPSRSTLKTVENLGATFKELITRYRELREAQRKGMVAEDELKIEVAAISKSIRSIISPLVVRRSRIDLQDIDEYRRDLKEQKIQLVIPNDPEELTYDLSGLKTQYLNTLDRISSEDGHANDGIFRFKAARYSPVLYIHDHFPVMCIGYIKVPEEKAEELKQGIKAIKRKYGILHAAQRFVGKKVETLPGVTCWQKAIAIDKVGLYIPGGTAPLFSTVLMLAVPAKIAGCKEIVLCTPPGRDGKIHPAILFAAQTAGVSRIFKAGGVQAIAAMAYGTESVSKVYKIFGPGNQYVTAAKQLVSLRDVAIDMPAGPSEVEVLADETANPMFVAADLLSQAEHGAAFNLLFKVCRQVLLIS